MSDPTEPPRPEQAEPEAPPAVEAAPPAPDAADAAEPAPDAATAPEAAEPAPADPAAPGVEPAPEAAEQPAATEVHPELTLDELRRRPSYLFFGTAASVSLVLDIASKAWAEIELSKRTLVDPSIVLVKDHLTFTLAYNKGGAWGLLHDASESVRKPFFLAVSALAIAFIVSLYSRLTPGQRSLKWGLPLVLGGALGNLSDRITRSSVIDFIDYRADWVESMNRFVARFAKGWTITDHWPTFNVADVFICIGVALMAIDMVTSRRKPAKPPPVVKEPEPKVESASPSTESSAPVS